MSIRILGVTGPSGSGKSLLCGHLSELGVSVIDADKVYHSLLLPPSPCLDALRDAFGETVLRPDGSLDRGVLSEIVFHDEKALSLLNQTVLGFVLAKIRTRIAELEVEGRPTVVVDAPTLIESGFHRECDTVLSVLSNEASRVKRIVERDHLASEQAEARIHAQKDDDFYRAHSDYVLTNNGNEKEFYATIDALLPQLNLFESPL